MFRLIPLAGLGALIWFLVRVVPKPSRAAYPCQRVAAPLAGSFVLWMAGAVGSVLAYRKAGELLKRSHPKLAFGCLVIAAMAAILTIGNMPSGPAVAADPAPNEPIGEAKGVHPGRVVWAYDPTATDWAGPGQGHWWESSHTSQDAVDQMMSRSIRSLAGQVTEVAAWDALIRQFNQTHGKGDVGYKAGEKVCVKVNLVGCIAGSGAVNTTSYDLVSGLDYMNTSPQVMRALLRQLVYKVGVNQADISIGDPICLFPNQYYDLCHGEFPNVHYLDYRGGNASHPRTRAQLSTVRFYWSARPTGRTADYVPAAYAEAAYFINLANFKAHTLAGVTLCGKNHYGSLGRTPVASGYFDMHSSLAGNSSGMGHYRALVDLAGHAHAGGKTLLYLIDGLYAGVHPTESSPRKWMTQPFNNDWTSSLFASQDGVAIDSVAFDFLWTEWGNYPRMSGADDYLHEAALANSPPSGTFYDPDHATNTVRLASLGVHEHWNNAQDRKYSRNLGTGNGIELIKAGCPQAVIQASPLTGRARLTVSFDGSGSFDLDGSIAAYLWDFDGDGNVDGVGPTITHVYTCCGDQVATLTVADNEGLTGVTSVRISIERQAGDMDCDYDVDQDDFGLLQVCVTGSAVFLSAECEFADLNGDRHVDVTDVSLFRKCMRGANQEADTGCAG